MRNRLGPATLWESPARKATARPLVWHGFYWAALGNVVYAITQFGTFVALAQLGTPEHVGQYALALAISGPVMLFFSLQLRAILASDADRLYAFAVCWRLRIITSPFAWTVVATIALFGRFGLQTAIVIFVAGIAKAIETFSDLCYGTSQRDNRLDLVGKSLAIKGPLSLAALVSLVWATQSVAVGYAGLGAVWLLLLVTYDLPNARRAEPAARRSSPWARPNFGEQRQLIFVGLPLAVSIALLSLAVALPNILVARYLGEREVGIFAAFTSLAWAGVPLINALGQTAMPRLGELYVTQNRRRLRALVVALAALGALLGTVELLGAWLVGEPVIALLYGREYSAQAGVLNWLMATSTLSFAGRFVADALTAMRATRIQLFVQGLTVAVVAVGGIAVLPQAGLDGIARILTAAFAVRFATLAGCFYIESGKLAAGRKQSCQN